MKNKSAYKYTAVTTSFALIILVLATLGIPYKNWGLKTDDFGVLYFSQTLCPQGLKKVFSTGNLETCVHPTGMKSKQSFFSGLYRPGNILLHYPQYKIFGNNAYGYFLTTIILHGINTALLFLLFLYFFNYFYSLLLSLLFAFHPSLANWIGWTAAQVYFVELLYLLLLTHCVIQALHKKNYIWWVCASILYLFTIFTKVATLVLPLCLTVGLFLYYNYKQSTTHSRKAFTYSLPFWIIALFYCFIRACVMGINSHVGTFTSQGTLASYFHRLSGRFFDIVSYVSDALMLSHLPKNNQLLKGSLIIIIITILCYLFYKSEQKKLLLFLLFCIVAFSWPIILIQYQQRYLYSLLPMILFLVGLLINNIKQHNTHLSICAISIAFTTFNIYYIKQLLTKREYVFGATKQAYENLLAQNQIKNKKPQQPLLFIGMPDHWFCMANAPAIWFLSKNNSFPIYEGGIKPNLSWQKSYLDKTFSSSCKFALNIEKNIINISSHTPTLLSFNNNLAAGSYKIPSNIMQQKPIVITWDYTHGNFTIVKNYEN